MKTLKAILAAVSALAAVSSMSGAYAATTVDAANRYAYGANIGWVDGRGDTNNGAVIGEYVCAGYIYSANVGWINLGNGAPTNGIYYQNLSTSDFGVNQDGAGNLGGLAYGANIGWINFETNGAPKVNLLTGQFCWVRVRRQRGLDFPDQCGGVCADGHDREGRARAGRAADRVAAAKFRNDEHIGHRRSRSRRDVQYEREYLAGTDPNNAADALRITFYRRNFLAASYNELTWNAKPSRYYVVQYNAALNTNLAWADFGSFSIAGVGAPAFLTRWTSASIASRLPGR